MGAYLNPGNSAFARILKSKYVDKTGLIGVINSAIDTEMSLTCISRPRRFGKSYAAKMLCAYYDRTVDSHDLFDNLAIAGTPDYTRHLNQYNVICLDMASINELLILANLENLNADMIKRNISKKDRLRALCKVADEQKELLDKVDIIKSLKKVDENTLPDAQKQIEEQPE